MTASGSNFNPIANGDLMYVHVYLNHFPLVNMRFFSHKDFRRAPAGISRVDISAPLAQTRKRRHRGEEACSAGASQSPDRAAGRRSTHLHTQPAHKMREEAPSPASTSERPWPSQLSGPRGCSVKVIPSVPSPLSTETKPLPLLTHHLKKDMNLITEGARRFCESESQSRCLLSNRALSPEPTGSLNRS